MSLSAPVVDSLWLPVALQVEARDLSKLLLISKEVTELLNRPMTLSLLQQRWSGLTGDFVGRSFSDLVWALDKKIVTVRSYRPENLNGRPLTQLLSRAAREGNLPAVKRGMELVQQRKPEDKTLERYLIGLNCWVLKDALVSCHQETIEYLLKVCPFTYGEYLAEAVATTHVLGSVVQDEIFARVLLEDPLAAELAKKSTFLEMFNYEVIMGAALSDQLELLQAVLRELTDDYLMVIIEEAYLTAVTSDFRECFDVPQHLGETYVLSFKCYCDALAQACLKGRRRLYDLILNQAKDSWTLDISCYQRVAREVIGSSPSDSSSNFRWLLETMEAEKIRFDMRQVVQLTSWCADYGNMLIFKELKTYSGRELDDYFDARIGIRPAK